MSIRGVRGPFFFSIRHAKQVQSIEVTPALKLLVPFLIATTFTFAQTPQQPASPPRPLILIDPAHGGNDEGASVANRTIEKDVTLAIANRLRPLLAARAFDTLFTRTDDTNPSTDDRAGVANTAHPIACIVLHASSTGTGVHLYASALPSATPAVPNKVPWDSAQSAYVANSIRLQNQVATAISRAGIAVSSSRTWIRPLDNMLCPAIAIEVAPLRGLTGETSPGNDGYQQRIAATIASALLVWRQQNPPATGTQP